MKARIWLADNGYHEVAHLIDEVMLQWKTEGKGTRRNWWDVLAGGKNGRPAIIAGRQFPVLEVAQMRQGKPVTENSLKLHHGETVPPKQDQARWRLHAYPGGLTRRMP